MHNFKIATWNVNSLRVRWPQVRTLLETERPHLLALQETKVADEQFSEEEFKEEFEKLGYRCAWHGQKSYNGVATLALGEAGKTIHAIRTGISGYEDSQCRVLYIQYGGLALLNLYVPNGSSVGSDKYQYKLEWLDQLRGMVQQRLAEGIPLVVAGDFNIAPEDRDVYDPQKWQGEVLVSAPERERFQALLGLGLTDVHRQCGQEQPGFTWWDYRRRGALQRDHGLRIDHILCSATLRPQGCRVIRELRAGTRPSDHAPVIAEFVLP